MEVEGTLKERWEGSLGGGVDVEESLEGGPEVPVPGPGDSEGIPGGDSEGIPGGGGEGDLGGEGGCPGEGEVGGGGGGRGGDPCSTDCATHPCSF